MRIDVTRRRVPLPATASGRSVDRRTKQGQVEQGSSESHDLRCDERRVPLKSFERFYERAVSVVGGQEEAVVSRGSSRRLPNTFHWIELRRIRRQSVELDAVGVRVKPTLPVFMELVPRTIVDNQEHFLSSVTPHDLLEETQEAIAVEDFFESIREARIV